MLLASRRRKLHVASGCGVYVLFHVSFKVARKHCSVWWVVLVKHIRVFAQVAAEGHDVRHLTEECANASCGSWCWLE
eukprot:10158329-Lingulodinium_polyedra.AAC.1